MMEAGGDPASVALSLLCDPPGSVFGADAFALGSAGLRRGAGAGESVPAFVAEPDVAAGGVSTFVGAVDSVGGGALVFAPASDVAEDGLVASDVAGGAVPAFAPAADVGGRGALDFASMSCCFALEAVPAFAPASAGARTGRGSPVPLAAGGCASSAPARAGSTLVFDLASAGASAAGVADLLAAGSPGAPLSCLAAISLPAPSPPAAALSAPPRRRRPPRRPRRELRLTPSSVPCSSDWAGPGFAAATSLFVCSCLASDSLAGVLAAVEPP